jgi:hypothetical protein
VSRAPKMSGMHPSKSVSVRYNKGLLYPTDTPKKIEIRGSVEI